MKQEKVYYIAKDTSNFRPGHPALVKGIRMCTPDSLGAEPRLCYKLQYIDGVIDYTPIGDGAFVLVAESELSKYSNYILK